MCISKVQVFVSVHVACCMAGAIRAIPVHVNERSCAECVDVEIIHVFFLFCDVVFCIRSSSLCFICTCCPNIESIAT